MDLRIDPAAKSLHGIVEVRALLLSSPPTELTLDLSRALSVDAVTAAYRTEMNKIAGGDLRGPIFMADVTDTRKLFGAATFDKGAWVLHMLRRVMGDEKSFEALRDTSGNTVIGT
jgi:hypothetical protein